MSKILRISFSVHITYLVNSILYALKKIPLVKRLLPDRLYRSKGLKAFAGVIAVIWEILSMLLGKFLYVGIMIFGADMLLDSPSRGELFLHIFLFLTIIGSYSNTDLFNPTRDKYYAIMLMRMDARAYTLVHYGYYLIRTVLGFLPCTVIFGKIFQLPLWICLILPVCIAGIKAFVSSLTLLGYEKRGRGYSENSQTKWNLLVSAILLACAYGLPALHILMPLSVSAGIFISGIPLGIAGLWKILGFCDYRAVNQELLSGLTNQMDQNTVTVALKKQNEKNIAADTGIQSKRRGLEYLNELFVKRHRKILWEASRRVTLVILAIILVCIAVVSVRPEFKTVLNRSILTSSPRLVFIMYFMNRGTNFTQALFLNCDHSLLTYSWFRRPRVLLDLFRIRLRELVKINVVPALATGIGLDLMLYVTGGTERPVYYVIILISVLSLSLFFSVHYLMLYYLIQPYNAETELKSGTYRIILSATYLVSFMLMQQNVSILLFGVLTIVFCVLYSIVASVMVYRLAPGTFRIRA